MLTDTLIHELLSSHSNQYQYYRL